MRTVAALLALAATLVHAQDAKNNVTLKWKFTKGQIMRYESTQKMGMDSEAMNMEQSNTYITRQTVKDVSEKGEATLEVLYEAIKFKMEGMQSAEFDSTKDKKAPEDPMGAAMASMLGQSFTMKIDSSGKIIEVNGFKAIMEKMFDEMGDEGEMARGMLEQMFDDKTMAATLQVGYALLPAEPVAKGSTWKRDFLYEIPMIGGIQYDLANTLKDVRKGDKGPEAVISQDIVISIKEGAMIQLDDSKGTAEIVFLVDKGMVSSAKTTAELNMKAGEQTFPMKMEFLMKMLPENERAPNTIKKGEKKTESKDEKKEEKQDK